MRRIQLFTVILTVSLSALLILFAVSMYLANTAPAGYQSSWTGQMWSSMGGMMDGYGDRVSSAPSYFWIIPVGLIGFTAVGVIGLAFYLAYPEIRPVTETYAGARRESVEAIRNPSATTNPYETISKTLTPEEQKVLDILMAHDGRYLQKYVRKEAGLSRLKTHRIIARFAQRGIVTVEQSGNTNEILVSDWLQRSKAQNPF